jgi:hypothetical protein
MTPEEEELQKQRSKELLPFTGIFGLYHNPVEGEEIYELTASWSYPSGSMVFRISCKELQEYIVLVKPDDKVIKNILVVRNDLYPGAYAQVFDSQVKLAREQGYTFIEVNAKTYISTPYKIFFDKALPDRINFNGHVVWGKYGFLMYEDEREELFARVMADHKHSEDFIHEIFLETAEADAAKTLWSGLRRSWRGEFSLEENSFSQQVFDGLKGRYARHQPYPMSYQ